MKVWLLFTSRDYEGDDYFGCFSSLEKATEAAEVLRPKTSATVQVYEDEVDDVRQMTLVYAQEGTSS